MHAIIELGIGLRAAFADARIRLLMLLTATLIGMASTAFHYVEGWGWVDSVYFSVVTIATIGYGDIVPKTDPGKIITIVYVLCGLGLFVATATAIADSIISNANIHRDRVSTGEKIVRRIREEL